MRSLLVVISPLIAVLASALACPPLAASDLSKVRGIYATASGRTFILAAWPGEPGRSALFNGGDGTFRPVDPSGPRFCATGGSTCFRVVGGVDRPRALLIESRSHRERASRVPIAATARSFTHLGVAHAGTLWLPPGSGPFPLVVLLGGTGDDGPDDFRIYPYLLARAGFAAYAFDKGGADGSMAGEEGVRPLAEEARSAIDAMTTLPNIDPKNVGVLGISHGAWVAVETARADPRVEMLVPIVGGGLPIWRATLFEDHNALVAKGYSAADVAAGDAFMAAVFDRLRRGEASALPALIALRSGAPWFKDLPLAPFAPLPPDRIVAIARDRWKGELSYDPAEALGSTTARILAIAGDQDAVVPGRENLAAIASAATARATTLLLLGADHRQALGGAGAFTYAGTLVPSLDDWLAQERGRLAPKSIRR